MEIPAVFSPDLFGIVVLVTVLFLAWYFLFSASTRHIPSDKKAILVTGCDSGFGFQLAVRAADQGFHVFAGCLKADSEGALSLQKISKIDVLVIDVRKQESIDAVLPHVEATLKRESLSLHGLVNNAGVNLAVGAAEWPSPETYAQTLDINTIGVVRVTRTFLPLIRAAKGRIVNVCSVAAHIAAPGILAYSMSKVATFMFTNGLRREMKRFGVYVSSISPFFYTTNITAQENAKRCVERTWKEISPSVQADYGGVETYEKLMARTGKTIPGIRSNTWEVIDCMMDALTNVNPKADYIPDLRSRITMAVIETVPLSWVDAIMGRRI